MSINTDLRLAVLVVAMLSPTASARPIVFHVHMEFEQNSRSPHWSESIEGTITADVETNSIIETDLGLSTDRSLIVGIEELIDARDPIILSDGWEVSETELSLGANAVSSAWSFSEGFFNAGGTGTIRHRLELLPDGQAILSRCRGVMRRRNPKGNEEQPRPYDWGLDAKNVEELPHLCADWEDAIDREFMRTEARIQLPVNSSKTGFLVGVAVPEPSSCGLLLFGMVWIWRAKWK